MDKRGDIIRRESMEDSMARKWDDKELEQDAAAGERALVSTCPSKYLWGKNIATLQGGTEIRAGVGVKISFKFFSIHDSKVHSSPWQQRREASQLGGREQHRSSLRSPHANCF